MAVACLYHLQLEELGFEAKTKTNSQFRTFVIFTLLRISMLIDGLLGPEDPTALGPWDPGNLGP